MPYYVKVQEYSNMESRDLWEYELTLSAAQVSRLVMHAWETRATHFDYYFFSRNCSYQLLALLEAADPDLHLIERLRAIGDPVGHGPGRARPAGAGAVSCGRALRS